MSRIIIFTGKGGVGKTSVISAHALRAARSGMNTLLVSADMAHNLGDVFETETGGELAAAEDRLTLLELDPSKIMSEHYPDLNLSIAQMLGGSVSRAAESIDSRFMIPGFEDLFMLLGIRDLYNSGKYDLILVDCAPSGETLSLLKLPELLEWYMEKFFPVGKFMTRVLSPVTDALYKVKLPDSTAMDQVSEMHQNLAALQDLLKDPQVTSVRLVTLPEKMVVEETKRTYMYLNLYGYYVDRVFINRVIPPQPGSRFMQEWRQIQQQYIEELESVFAHIPITQIPWFPEEIRGIRAVELLSRELPENPVLFARPKDPDGSGTLLNGAETYEVTEEGYVLRLRMPGAESVSVELHGQDLDIRAGNMLRKIPLPSVLHGAEIMKTEVKDEMLSVFFLPEKARLSRPEKT